MRLQTICIKLVIFALKQKLAPSGWILRTFMSRAFSTKDNGFNCCGGTQAAFVNL